jgi:hypothetical protein
LDFTWCALREFIFCAYMHATNCPTHLRFWGGVGDIMVTALALVVILSAKSRPALIAWNILGLVDIVADRSAIGNRRARFNAPVESVSSMILLPTFIVPVVIVTHGLMLMRLGPEIR